MRDNNQKQRYNQIELELFKSLFKENEDLLYLVRKVMLQGELTEIDKQNLKECIKPEVATLLRKHFNPEIEHDAPIGQVAHLGLSLGAEIKQLSPDGAWPFIKAKELEMEYLDQQLKVLAGEEVDVKIKLADLINMGGVKTQREQKYINIIAWNWLLSWIDSCTSTMKSLAHQTKESAEEAERIRRANSNQ